MAAKRKKLKQVTIGSKDNFFYYMYKYVYCNIVNKHNSLAFTVSNLSGV